MVAGQTTCQGLLLSAEGGNMKHDGMGGYLEVAIGTDKAPFQLIFISSLVIVFLRYIRSGEFRWYHSSDL